MDVFEAMETCRAIRYLKPDPVPDELITKLVWAATRAPSPGNSQGWHFVVVTDAAPKKAIGAAIEAAMAARLDGRTETGERSSTLMLRGALNLARTVGDAPVLIVVCGGVIYPPERPDERFTWSALYPAAQNLILAARALGLGTTFTTFHHIADATIRSELGIPADVRIACMIPVGWPDRAFGPVNRNPVESVIHREHW